MYLNVISFKNGKSVAFQSEIPYSIDKVAEGWNLVNVAENSQIISFKGSEIVSIVNQDMAKVKDENQKTRLKTNGKKPALKTGVTKEH